jgi:3-hydroxyacyl-CoA dehydrogenase
MGMFRTGVDEYIMNRDRLLPTAIDAALAMAPSYAVSKRGSLQMAGRDVWQEMIVWLEKAQDKGFLTPHDVTTGTQIAMIVTGGDIDAGTGLSEQDLFDLERKAFVTLAQTPQTRARIEHMLSFGSPLRN